MWQCFVQFMKVICFTSLLVWDAKSDWAEEPVLLTPLESILELLLIFLQISSGFFVTRIFTVLDAYGLVAVIQLKLLRPENTGIPRWFLPVLILFFFFPFCLTLSEDAYHLGEKMILICQLCLIIWSVPLVLLHATLDYFRLPYAFISSLSFVATWRV